jgi:hypothetical protein
MFSPFHRTLVAIFVASFGLTVLVNTGLQRRWSIRDLHAPHALITYVARSLEPAASQSTEGPPAAGRPVENPQQAAADIADVPAGVPVTTDAHPISEFMDPPEGYPVPVSIDYKGEGIDGHPAAYFVNDSNEPLVITVRLAAQPKERPQEYRVDLPDNGETSFQAVGIGNLPGQVLTVSAAGYRDAVLFTRRN